MRPVLPFILLSAAIAALVSLMVATLLRPDPPRSEVGVLPATPAPPGVQPASDLSELRTALARLEEEVQALRLQVAQASSARREVRPASAESSDVGFAASLARLDPAGEEVLRAEVSKVIAQLEEEKAAAAWEEELAKRREKAVGEFAEYDEVDLNLATTVASLVGELGLGSSGARDVQSLLALQNDRNREMTRLWSEGSTPQAELERIFHANRAKHRAEIRALVGEGAVETYKQFVRDGGLGKQFSFFTGPWEDWAQTDD